MKPDFFIDMDYRSANHIGEELCGDKVEMVTTDHSHILILADGMGSGVKANIFSTLTSKILATMFREGATIDEALEAILSTLPICSERHVAYCTFTVLVVNDDNSAYLVEYDNPDTILIRDGKSTELPRVSRTIQDKTIKESRFTVQDGDVYVMTSDGCIWCSPDQTMNFKWNRDSNAEIVRRSARMAPYAKRISYELVQECIDEYAGRPADDTTAACMRISTPLTLRIMTGPPVHKEDDERIVKDLMALDENGNECYKIVCGGTTAKIVSRILKHPIESVKQMKLKDVPPYDYIEDIDLVTEGILTINKALSFLDPLIYHRDELDDTAFFDLDDDNGPALLATALLENCSHLELLVGQAINEAYEEMGINTDLALRHDLVKRLAQFAKDLGKTVTIKYY